MGAILGTIGARVLLVGSGLVLIPWGACALAVGYLSTDRHRALVDGATFGFALAFTFMIVGYDGATGIAIRLPFFALLGLFGAGCGLTLSLGAHRWAPRRRSRSSSRR